MSANPIVFPPIDPYRTGRLQVSDLHRIYFEECGNPNGKPALFIHGGPGGGIEPAHRQLFDPARYRIVLFDQRGCGQSTPHAELRDNTTWDLVADMERLRCHLDIESWMLFGGSWGSTLALAYATRHADRISQLVLRGIFLLRQEEIDWFYQDGAGRFFPKEWAAYCAPIPQGERSDMVRAYHRRLTSDDAAARQQAAKAWSVWEASTSTLRPSAAKVAQASEDDFADAFARIECHYFLNRGFFPQDGFLLHEAARYRHLPAAIVQGRYDMVCPIKSAWDLSQAWPRADMSVIEDAGHAYSEQGTLAALIAATNRFARED
jgi:proline iminopeptidase